MKAKQIALILIPLNVLLAYLVYNSINSEIKFQKAAEIRLDENIQKLKDSGVDYELNPYGRKMSKAEILQHAEDLEDVFQLLESSLQNGNNPHVRTDHSEEGVTLLPWRKTNKQTET